jgi:hypothetical protein
VRALGAAGGRGIDPVRLGQAAGILVLQAALVVVHQPRVDALFVHGIPADSLESVESELPTPALRLAAARDLAGEFARRQRLDLAKLDQAEARARGLGAGADAIGRVFGRVEVVEIPKVYDAAGMLDLPATSTFDDPPRLRAAIGDLFEPSKPPVLRFDPNGRGFYLAQ